MKYINTAFLSLLSIEFDMKYSEEKEIMTPSKNV